MFWCDSVPPLARPAWPAAESVTQSVLVRPDPGMDTTSQEEQLRAPGPTTFKMYYALSPEMEQTNSIDYLETSAEINSQKQTYFTLTEHTMFKKGLQMPQPLFK